MKRKVKFTKGFGNMKKGKVAEFSRDISTNLVEKLKVAQYVTEKKEEK